MSKLPRGIRKRERPGRRPIYEFNFVDQYGIRRWEHAPSKRAAAKQRNRRIEEVAQGAYQPPTERHELTVEGYAEAWLAQREKAGKRSVKDEATHLRKHIFPFLGDRELSTLRPRDVAALVEHLRGGHLSAKSIRNVHGTLHVMLERAVFDEHLIANPAHLPRGMLPSASKKGGPRFTRRELWQLLTDERIAEHRRVFYALQGLTGMRLGEASGRRWRDYDRETPELGSLMVASQYDDQPLKTAKDEDTKERLVPVHPALAQMLARWRLEGFERLYGMSPCDGLWICPDPRTGDPRTQNQAIKALYRDCARIGIPRRGCHSFRRAFISLARSDGAPKDVVESITHNAAGDIVDVYTSWEWEPRCRAVAGLRFSLGRDEVLELPGAKRGRQRGRDPIQPGIVVEAAGVEVASGESTPSDPAELREKEVG